MQNIGPSLLTPSSIFTATFPGIHTFTAVDTNSLLLGGQFFLNGDGIQAYSQIADATGYRQLSLQLYMVNGDVLSYQGPAATLAGVRIGDEL